ncbi:MAG TPA: phosphoribosyltransferase [Mycobacteriales bacterium]|nr:phosphoribosyltransferase [Mycobacteriales bacterium]
MYDDRAQAGRELARSLAGYAHRADVMVLGLPRGGVPVAAEVARVLVAPLDVFVVRKLGVPGHRELAMGAIASGGIRVMNDPVLRAAGISEEAVERVAAEEGAELRRREEIYRGERPPLSLTGRVVILVDDGLATGASMRAAVEAARRYEPARVVVAVPVAPAQSVRELGTIADEVVCCSTPADFTAVGSHYRDFRETTDDEVRALLHGDGGSPG